MAVGILSLLWVVRGQREWYYKPLAWGYWDEPLFAVDESHILSCPVDCENPDRG